VDEERGHDLASCMMGRLLDLLSFFAQEEACNDQGVYKHCPLVIRIVHLSSEHS
jgi:hypothetical protein